MTLSASKYRHPYEAARSALGILHSRYLQTGKLNWFITPSPNGDDEFASVGLSVEEAQTALAALVTKRLAKPVGQLGVVITEHGINAWDDPIALARQLPVPASPVESQETALPSPTPHSDVAVRLFNCLLISPGDVRSDFIAVEEQIALWNEHTGPAIGARIIAKRWERARPEIGQAQQVINRRLVDDSHFGIALFWGRLGTPTDTHPSGSDEEIDRLTGQRHDVMVYFCERPIPSQDVDADQLKKLAEQRKSHEQRRLVATYETADELAAMVGQHLTSLVSDLLKQPAPPTSVAGPVVITASRPDIRIQAKCDVLPPFSNPTVCVRILVLNHSPAPWHFDGLQARLPNGLCFDINSDDHGNEILFRTIESGRSAEVRFVPTLWGARGPAVEKFVAVDEIGREYESDPEQVSRAIEEYMRVAKKFSAP